MRRALGIIIAFFFMAGIPLTGPMVTAASASTHHAVSRPMSAPGLPVDAKRGCDFCFKIVTKNGTPTGVGFNSDSVGEGIRSIINGSFPGRDWLWFQTSNSCPGVANCSQGHWKTVDGLRMVAANCSGSAPLIDLSTDSDQTGDVWFYWSDPNGNHYIISRHCYSGSIPDLAGTMSTDEVNNDYWNFSSDWLKIQLFTDPA